MSEEFKKIQQMVNNNTRYIELEETVTKIASDLPIAALADLVRQLSDWKKTLDSEHQKEQNEKFHDIELSNRLRGTGDVGDAFSDFQSEQRDNEFRGDAQMHSEKMEKIDLIMAILQRGKSE